MRRLAPIWVALVVLLATGCAGGTTDTAIQVTDHAATLRAHGTAGGDPTQYWFEYGASTSYGSSTPHRAVNTGQELAEVLWIISPPSY